MEVFSKLFKKNKKKKLEQELDTIAEEFADVKLPHKNLLNSVHSHPINNHHSFGSFGSLGLDMPKEKRVRSVSKKDVEGFTNRINLKIATLIRLRANTTNQEDIDSLSISIDILEMTREMLIEVFIKIPEDEPDLP